VRRPDGPVSVLRIGLAVARHPSLWPVAMRQWRRTTPPRWWRRRPFLPVPSAEYLRFRLLTQYGDPRARVDGADVVNYLAWCRTQP
jgi:hypothetical protein